MMANICTVCNVKVNQIRPLGFKNIKEWTDNENNLYIGRRGVVFITNGDTKERFPKQDSKWCNPFKITKNVTREEVLNQFEEYIKKKIEEDPIKYNLDELIGKNLGCWCFPELCHGHVLQRLITEKKKKRNNVITGVRTNK